MVRFIAMLLVSVGASMSVLQTSKQIVNVGPAPVGPYSVAVRTNDFIYVSGMLSQDDTGAMVGADVAAQTKRILDRVRTVLEAAGSSLEQAVAVTVYLRSASDFAAMNEAYRTYWPKDPPTRTTVMTELLLGALVEISVVAVPNGTRRTVIHPEGWMRSPNPYSYAIKTGDTLFLSGLVPRSGRDNSAVLGDISIQTKTIMDNARDLLREAQMDLSNIVSARVYLPDTAAFPQMNAIYGSYFKKDPPARATVKAGLAGKGFGVEITFVASSAPRVAISPNPTLPLSGAVQAGNRLHLSGVLGNTSANAGDPTAQTREVLSRIRKTLESAGYAPAQVVESIVYLTDLSQFQAMNAEYREFFGKDFPARTTVGTGLVAPGAVVEIMMTAVK